MSKIDVRRDARRQENELERTWRGIRLKPGYYFARARGAVRWANALLNDKLCETRNGLPSPHWLNITLPTPRA